MFGFSNAWSALGAWHARREQDGTRVGAAAHASRVRAIQDMLKPPQDDEPIGMAEKPRSEDEQAYDWFRQREADMWIIRDLPYAERLSAFAAHLRCLLKNGDYTLDQENALRADYGLLIGGPEPAIAKSDTVNHPSHYTTGGIECYDAMAAMLSTEEMIGYLRGNSFKYRWRFRHKNGIEDLRKAEWYEKKLAELISGGARG